MPSTQRGDVDSYRHVEAGVGWRLGVGPAANSVRPVVVAVPASAAVTVAFLCAPRRIMGRMQRRALQAALVVAFGLVIVRGGGAGFVAGAGCPFMCTRFMCPFVLRSVRCRVHRNADGALWPVCCHPWGPRNQSGAIRSSSRFEPLANIRSRFAAEPRCLGRTLRDECRSPDVSRQRSVHGWDAGGSHTPSDAGTA